MNNDLRIYCKNFKEWVKNYYNILRKCVTKLNWIICFSPNGFVFRPEMRRRWIEWCWDWEWIPPCGALFRFRISPLFPFHPRFSDLSSAPTTLVSSSPDSPLPLPCSIIPPNLLYPNPSPMPTSSLSSHVRCLLIPSKSPFFSAAASIVASHSAFSTLLATPALPSTSKSGSRSVMLYGSCVFLQIMVADIVNAGAIVSNQMGIFSSKEI